MTSLLRAGLYFGRPGHWSHWRPPPDLRGVPAIACGSHNLHGQRPSSLLHCDCLWPASALSVSLWVVFTAQTCSVLGSRTLRPFLKPFGLTQAGECGIHRGRGCGRRPIKGEVLVAEEDQAVTEASPRLKEILEVLT